MSEDDLDFGNTRFIIFTLKDEIGGLAKALKLFQVSFTIDIRNTFWWVTVQSVCSWQNIQTGMPVYILPRADWSVSLGFLVPSIGVDCIPDYAIVDRFNIVINLGQFLWLSRLNK